MARIPNEDLLKLRDTFGIDEQFLLSDLNDYTMDAPVEEVDDGIASIDTALPIYTRDGNDNNFLEYSSMDGAPAYIRDRETAAPINYQLQDPTIMKMANFDEMFGPKTFTDSMGNVRTVPGEERFTLPKEKTGILQSIKDGGSKFLDFIKGGGITGNLIRGLLPEQSPEAIFMKDYYGGEDGSNIKDGTIQSGLMAGYNPVSGNNFLNRITGGFLPGQTFGLQNAYDRRIATIRNTLARKYGDPNYKGDKTKLDERLEKLIEEKRKEKEALRIATENRQRAAQESQRQADQARINRAYREETGGQGGSYATGQSGVQKDGSYNDPFDPGGGE